MMSTEPTTTTRGAAEALGIGDRQVRRLIKAKRLDVTGSGQGRRITWESIERYREEVRKADISPDMSLRMSASSVQDRTMEKLIRTIPPLSQPRSAARRLGIATAVLEDLLRTGQAPSIVIGAERFVPRHWLVDVLAQANGFGAMTPRKAGR